MAILILGITALSIRAQEPTRAQYQSTVNRCVDFLRQQQANDGSFSKAAGIGPTGIVASGLLSVGVPATDPVITKALTYLETYCQADGGIYTLESSHRNYDTCIAMVAFSQANQDHRYDERLKKAEAFVKGLQWDESEDKDPSDSFYGGAGYGSQSRPDLSNTAYLIDALRSLGNPPDDPAIQKALIFVSRCQNLESEHNSTEFAAKIDDGGFYYTVAAGGESKAGSELNGGLRSYGSMTYAGLKSMIFAGLEKEDARVTAALEFLRDHWSLDENPGMGEQGLYYYYQTMARALDAWGEEEFLDGRGRGHAWRSQLLSKLIKLQQPNGSWVNETSRWMEGDPNLVCGYVLLTLARCQPVD
ncbi:MAG: hypothetical protein KDB03_03395 [Planctomycetales bacterium]|nr:hypothetical protein [Planctomycetales bacterium]